MNKEDIKGLKYYIGFCGILLCVYVYSMLVGWRFMSINQTEHTKNGHSSSHYYKRNHK